MEFGIENWIFDSEPLDSVEGDDETLIDHGFDSAPLPSRPDFPKVQVHGKFLHRVSREGLGTSEM